MTLFQSTKNTVERWLVEWGYKQVSVGSVDGLIMNWSQVITLENLNPYHWHIYESPTINYLHF